MFALVLGKITRANDPRRGPGQDVPPLEDLPVRPYVNDDRMTVDKNNSAKVLWDFKEKQAKKARKMKKRKQLPRRKPLLPAKLHPTERKQNYARAP